MKRPDSIIQFLDSIRLYHLEGSVIVNRSVLSPQDAKALAYILIDLADAAEGWTYDQRSKLQEKN